MNDLEHINKESEEKEEVATPLDLSEFFGDLTDEDTIKERLAPSLEHVPTIEEDKEEEAKKALIPVPSTKEIIDQIKKLNVRDPIEEKQKEINDLFEMIKYTPKSEDDDEIIFYLEQLNIFPKLRGQEILQMIRNGRKFKQIIQHYKTPITKELLNRNPTQINTIFKRHVKIIHNPYYKQPFLN